MSNTIKYTIAPCSSIVTIGNVPIPENQPGSIAPIRLFGSRFNATLRDGQSDGLLVDAFRSEAIHRVQKRRCAVSEDDSNIEHVTN